MNSEERYKHGVIDTARYLFELATGSNGGNGDGDALGDLIVWFRWRISTEGWTPSNADPGSEVADIESAIHQFAVLVNIYVSRTSWMDQLAYRQWRKGFMAAGQGAP